MTSRPPQSLSEDRVDDSRIRNPVLDAAADFNAHNAVANAAYSTALLDSPSATPIHFRSTTTAPSPTLADPLASSSSSKSDDLDSDSYIPSPLGPGNGLRVQSNAITSQPRKGSFSVSPGRALSLARKSSAQSLKGVSRTPSIKAALANSIGSSSVASSTVPSPIISAMGDVTPLPSPLLSSDSPGPWRRLAAARPTSRDGLLPVPSMQDSVLISSNGESISAALANQAKRKAYASLNAEQREAVAAPAGPQQHVRNRSTSEYIPDPRLIPQRHTTVSGARTKKSEIGPSSAEPHMRREPHLSEARGLTPTSLGQPPTPPPSEPSESALDRAKPKQEYFEARDRHDQRLRRWRAVRFLGQGTFSRVVLATSQTSAHKDGFNLSNGGSNDNTAMPTSETLLDRKTLVAVKICEHGPRGGASEDRVEMSLKRELEILRSIQHPSLVHLKAWNIEPTRAILVLSYCPGGDLFDVASQYREVLTSSLLERIFAELVGAVQYLHDRRIVHRDIKLENVLVNLAPAELSDSSINWQSYQYSVVTLADLGLSRRIADDEKLETRCGSDDYAAPEVILGQSYDGRATDAWSLGVLLYALLESRLPFDPLPGMPDAHRLRSRTSHRIARVEWRWIEYAGEDGDHDGNEAKFKSRNLLGAMEITEGLLKRARSRWTMAQVAEHGWVKGGIQVEGSNGEFGGLKFRDEDEGEEVL